MSLYFFVVILGLCGLSIVEGLLRFTVGDQAIKLSGDGTVTVGKVPADSLTFEPTEDENYVISQILGLTLFDSAGQEIKSYNFSQNTANFQVNSETVSNIDSDVRVNGRRLVPTGVLAETLGEEIINLNVYIFTHPASLNFSGTTVDVKLYDFMIELVMGRPGNQDACPTCEDADEMQLILRFYSAGKSRMSASPERTEIRKEGGVAFLVPSLVNVDGEFEIAEGNPAISTNGDNVDIALRVPAFVNNATYQVVVISPEEKEEEEEVLPPAGEEVELEEPEAEYKFSTKPADEEDGEEEENVPMFKVGGQGEEDGDEVEMEAKEEEKPDNNESSVGVVNGVSVFVMLSMSVLSVVF